MILMNLGKTEQMVNVSKFTNSFNNKLRVMVAGAETPYEKGLEASVTFFNFTSNETHLFFAAISSMPTECVCRRTVSLL